MTEAGTWHVHFDGDSAVALHVCEQHRAMGQSLKCPDEDPATGDCAHVQTRRCDCSPPPTCDGCVYG